jgi:hypothetical protein
LLESASHVAEESHSCDFDYHLEEILIKGVAFDIPIAYRGKGGVDPIDRSNIEAVIVKLLNIEIMVDIYPSVIEIKLLQPNKYPNAREEMRNENNQYQQAKEIHEPLLLVTSYQVFCLLKEKIIKMMLKFLPVIDFNESDHDILDIDRVPRDQRNDVQCKGTLDVQRSYVKWQCDFRVFQIYFYEEGYNDVQNLNQDYKGINLMMIKEIVMLLLDSYV